MKAAVILTNYNMPERSNALVESLANRCNPALYDFILVDNASDTQPPSKYSTILLDHNVQTTGGWLKGHALAKGKYDAYIFTITSAELANEGNDIISELLATLSLWKDAVMVSPALTPESTTTWGHMKYTGCNKERRVEMLDNIFCMYRADWFDAHDGFDPRFIYAWGPDLEMSYLARTEHKDILLNEKVQIGKDTDIGYSMDRMNMRASERQIKATENMTRIMQQKYGYRWRSKMYSFRKDLI